MAQGGGCGRRKVFKVWTRLYLRGFGPGWSLSAQLRPPAKELTAQALRSQLIF